MHSSRGGAGQGSTEQLCSPAAFLAFLWFVAFCFLANQWQRTTLSRGFAQGADAARAAITFSFFSIIVWVRAAPEPRGQSRNETCPGSGIWRSGSWWAGRAGLGWAGETCGASTRGDASFLPGELQLSLLSLGNSRLPFLPRLGSFVPFANVSPAMSCPDFRSWLEPQGGSLEAQSPQEQISALRGFMAWLGHFGGSQAPQLPPGTSQIGPSAVHTEKGLLETPFAPNFGSTWAEGLQPGLCGTLSWGGCAARGAPAPGAVCGAAGTVPCHLNPSCSFSWPQSPGLCSNSMLPSKNWGKSQSEAFQQQALLQFSPSLTAPCFMIIPINLL